MTTTEEARQGRSRTLRRVAAAFGPYRATVAVIAVVIVVTAGLGVVNPLLIQQVFDTALFTPAGVDVERLLWLIAIMLAVPVVSGGLGVWQTYLANRVGQHVMRDLRDALYVHLHRMPLRFFTAIGTFLMLVSIGLAIPILITYLEEGIVPRLPTAVLSTGLMIVAVLSVSSGLVLDTVTRGRREMKLLAYLSQPAISRD
jgi:ABC-type multidrug transport system fused ATPase/permease subunit